MNTSLPDILSDNLSVVFCGLNPGLSAVAAQHHFVGRGNRFWRVIYLAGFTLPKSILRTTLRCFHSGDARDQRRCECRTDAGEFVKASARLV